MSDLPGYLEAFGSPVRVKGVEYLGIIEDDYAEVELGRARAASNAPQILFAKADVRQMSLATGDTVQVKDTELGTWATFLARSPQFREDGFVLVPLMEAT